MENSDYVVYVDESGDANIDKVDPQYPIFVLTFCIFQKEQYASTVSPSIQRLKFKHFNHDNVVLHEYDIRKPRGQFAFLRDTLKRADFMTDLVKVISDAPMTIIAAVIKKDELKQQYVEPAHPYEMALKFCMERTYRFMCESAQADRQTVILAEGRGKAENDTLELAFRRIVDGGNFAGERMNCFKLMFAAKGVNLGGMQLADLTARPIGLSVLRPDQPNRAYEIIEPKIRRGPKGVAGFGLKVFP